MSEPLVGPSGFLRHCSSGAWVRTRYLKQGIDTPLALNEIVPKNPNLIQFRFVFKEGAGHFGYIEHVCSKMVIGIKNHTLSPADGTSLVLHAKKDASALFGFDVVRNLIFQQADNKNGATYWRPKYGVANPRDGTPVVVNSETNAATTFCFVDSEEKFINPYPIPDLLGTWVLIKSIYSPKSTYTFTEKYKVGNSMSTSSMEMLAWNISAKFAKGLFSAEAEFSRAASKSSSETWSEQTEKSQTITVTPGQSVFMWQYMFFIQQNYEEMSFLSNMIGDTHSIDETPTTAS